MNVHSSRRATCPALGASIAALLLLGAGSALGQPAGGASGGPAAAGAGSPGAAAGAAGPTNTVGTPVGGTGFGARDPSPYYLGVSQGFTHESNVFRSPNGRSDTYSSTSLLGGLDQRIGRQRVFGTATVSANRYFNEKQLDNTSYLLAAGLDWETVNKLSGNLNAGLSQNLAAPVASGVVPGETRNIARTESVGATIRYGGASLLTLQGTLGYARARQSDPTFTTGNSRSQTGSLGLVYSPGGPLRLGVAGRLTRTEIPQALFDPFAGTYQSNTLDGKHLDFTVDYRLSGIVDASTRLSYTRQTNSNPLISGSDFSGLTGSANVAYRWTGKTSFNLSLGRDAGVTSSTFNGFVIDQSQPTPVRTLQAGTYQNNQVTNYAGLTATYAATGKTTANAGVRYSRAKLLTTLVTSAGGTATPETTDVAKVVFLGVNHELARNLGVACTVSHEARDLSGGIAPYSYTANSIGCLAQYTWR